MDKYMIFKKRRWVFSGIIALIYISRIINVGGFYVISYVLGLFILHSLVQFVTPKGLPDIDEDDTEGNLGDELPLSNK